MKSYRKEKNLPWLVAFQQVQLLVQVLHQCELPEKAGKRWQSVQQLTAFSLVPEASWSQLVQAAFEF